MHWLRFCCAAPQVVPLTVAGVKLVGVKATDEAAVESVGDVIELPEAGRAVVLAAVEAVLFVPWARMAGKTTMVAIKAVVG